jgi:long-subunit acyl-CoA synthetase (AMP-forming)
MFSRYINMPEKTAAEFSGVFFKTGDIAARELVGQDGVYFKILGRASMVTLPCYIYICVCVYLVAPAQKC